MPTVDDLRARLIDKLKDLFQLNQPDLDFGFYRIMHAKAEQVTRFLETNLPAIIKAALGDTDETRRQELLDAWNNEIQQALGYGVSDPHSSPKVKEARARYDAAADTMSLERQIYDHLYRFFERYYEDGDFVSRRYYVRESDSRAAPYAVPYSGEEVKLVWANMDQYYIKTAEYFTNFTVDLAKATFVETRGGGAIQTELFVGEAPANPQRVHFVLVAASEGEHGNVKAGEATRRYFQVYHPDPVGFDARGELVLRFTYRPDPEKTGQDAGWREKRNAEAVQVLLAQLQALAPGDARAAAYLQALLRPASTEKDPKRPLLAKYINQYTARNTMDYFIHKDLGGFLRRELDFYIKNEVMRLDDIAGADALRAEQYLVQVRVLRAIAGKLIAFLAQLENFQKKLWLKKKFVVETHYCITLDRILAIEDAAERDWLLQQIAANDAQREEWVRLFAIDEIGESTVGPRYSVPLTVDFIAFYQWLPIDTVFFVAEFYHRLITVHEDLDEATEGLLVHSDNSQALRLLEKRMRKQVQCIHIDPPYNTQTSGFLYPNAYQHSSWMIMMQERMQLGVSYLDTIGSFVCHIDENEYERLHLLAENLGMPDAGTIVWDKRNPMNGGRGVARQHEYILWRTFLNSPLYLPPKNAVTMLNTVAQLLQQYGYTEEMRRRYVSWLDANEELSGGEKAYRYIDEEGRVYQSVSLRAPEPRFDRKFHQPLIHPITKKPCPVPPNGFSRTPETLQRMQENGEILFGADETIQPRQKVLLTRDSRRQLPSVIEDARKGRADLAPLGLDFPYCHPLSLYSAILGVGASSPDAIVLDYFAGSGTTGHAAISLNREEGSSRRYILVEAGNHFDNVLKPRILKANYSSNWNHGSPAQHSAGRSYTLKYLRLESYEDCLNNLEFQDDAERQAALDANPQLAEEHLLHYMLDVETAGSASLLNLDSFADPTAYRLKVKLPGSDAYAWRTVDLLETFNYLLGLRVQHIAAPQTFTAAFVRPPDPELPQDGHTRLQIVSGSFRPDPAGPWCIRTVEGWLPQDADQPQAAQADPNRRRRILVVWRKLTGDPEQDNLVLDEWFRRHHINPRDREYDTIYVNGSNNLPNLRRPDDLWKVRLIEEDFLRLMWDTEGN